MKAGSAAPSLESARPGREDAARARLEAIARLLDSRWRVPGTRVTFGADAVLNLVPVAGWVGDVFYRANLRNTALLRAHLDRRGRPTR